MSEERNPVGAQFIAPSLQHSTTMAASRSEGVINLASAGAITGAINCAPTCVEGHCITCSDEALQIRVLSVDCDTGIALVELGEKTEEIDVSLVEEVAPGDLLLVHGGVAIASIKKASEE